MIWNSKSGLKNGYFIDDSNYQYTDSENSRFEGEILSLIPARVTPERLLIMRSNTDYNSVVWWYREGKPAVCVSVWHAAKSKSKQYQIGWATSGGGPSVVVPRPDRRYLPKRECLTA